MKKLLIIACLLINVLMAKAQYCMPHTTNLYSHHQIQYFQFDSLINITSSVNPLEYNDYSSNKIINTKLGGKHFVLMSKGQNPSSPGVGNSIGFSIWIDFNNDYNFSNTERVYSKYQGGYP